jgi:hypothetical protein
MTTKIINMARAQQQRLVTALNVRARALGRDENGDWRITGRHGHIYLDGPGWLLYVADRRWSWTKNRLDFCTVTQDGDDEGCLHLRALPTPSQAATIREVLGIHKRKATDPARIERLRSSLTRSADGVGAAA